MRSGIALIIAIFLISALLAVTASMCKITLDYYKIYKLERLKR